MVRADCLTIVVFVVTADTITSLAQNNTIRDVNNDLKRIDGRRNKYNKKSLSTSSESGDHRSEEGSEMSLGLSTESSSTSDEEHRGYRPKSTEERKGWRKWHRKCSMCPNDMVKKWRDRNIKWICGAYQRARRSFKSECMMHYRNCQDGTMFVKIHDHRCQDDSNNDIRHGLHFFYEYGRDSQSSKSDSISDSSSMQVSSEIDI